MMPGVVPDDNGGMEALGRGIECGVTVGDDKSDVEALGRFKGGGEGAEGLTDGGSGG
jgi:hypothetical protein